ncbi:amino acid ABC transporter substrate-binding protein (plasmid) [Sinorhizobium meliloti]|nr:amino acid ABC transporter substrate-binding protein [Sinorhizobium meliloti]
MRALFATLVFVAFLPHPCPEVAQADTLPTERLTVGVRDDARPFIWRDPATKDYLGFFWDICTEAVQRAGYHVQPEEVDAEKRAKFLTTGEGDFDLLCDPTTITLRRMQNFAHNGRAPALEFSPIVFVANGSYVQLKRVDDAPKASGRLPNEAPNSPSCGQILQWLQYAGDRPPENWTWPAGTLPGNQGAKSTEVDGGDATAEGLLEWLERRFDFTLRRPQGNSEETKTFEIWGYVEGSTIGETLEAQIGRRSQGNWVICPIALPSHTKAAAEFCAHRLARYFGDLDIIKAALTEHRERNGSGCAADNSSANVGTYEPYAFVLSSHRFPDFPERLTLALYEMFGDGTIERLFAGHFPGAKKSQHLSTLFRINSIPEGTDTRLPPGAQLHHTRAMPGDIVPAASLNDCLLRGIAGIHEVERRPASTRHRAR